MLAYYIRLALRSFRRNKVLTGLMVLAMALGICASITTLTVFYVLSGDPIPDKSKQLFYVRLDPRIAAGYTAGEEPPEQLTRLDAQALLADKRAKRQAMMAGGEVSIKSERLQDPFLGDARYSSSDFFGLFEVPFRFGRGWSTHDDDARSRVAVISQALNNRLFGGANSVGESIQVEGQSLRVIGVLEHWAPAPHFYDLNTGTFEENEDVYLPFSTAMEMKFTPAGTIECFGRSAVTDNTALAAPCAWVQYWAELETPAQVADYLAYLNNYSAQQRAAGRFQRPPNVRLSDVMQWLGEKQVVPSDVRLQTWLALGFLMVCLINTTGLLLAKFLRRSNEVGIRRALGASRSAIFQQCLIEAAVVGLAGGILGIALSLVALWAVRQQPTGYAKLAHLDLPMLAAGVALTLVAGLLSGALPAWRAIQVAPALQLKSQ